MGRIIERAARRGDSVKRRMGQLSKLAKDLDARIVAPFTLERHNQNLAPNAPAYADSGYSEYTDTISHGTLGPPATNTQQLSFGTQGDLGIGSDGITMVMRIRFNNARNSMFGNFTGDASAAAAYRCGMHFPYNTNGTTYFDYGGDAAGYYSTVRLSFAWSRFVNAGPDDINTFIFTAGYRGMSVWADGYKVSADTPGNTQQSSKTEDASIEFGIGGAMGSGGSMTNGFMRPEAIWVFNGGVSPKEAQLITQDPYKALVAPRRVVTLGHNSGTGGVSKPQGPFGHPLFGPFRGPL